MQTDAQTVAIDRISKISLKSRGRRIAIEEFPRIAERRKCPISSIFSTAETEDICDLFVGIGRLRVLLHVGTEESPKYLHINPE